MNPTGIRAALIAAVLCCATDATAHPAPFSYLDIAFRGGAIEGSLVVHVIDIAHELSVAPPDGVLDPAFLARERQRIFDVISSRMSLTTDRPLMIQWGSIEPMKEELALRLRYRIPDEHPGALAIDTNLFPYDPLHQTFVNVYEDARSASADDLQRRQHGILAPTTSGRRRARWR